MHVLMHTCSRAQVTTEARNELPPTPAPPSPQRKPQGVVSHLTWVLATELRPSARAVCVPKHRALSLQALV